MTEREHQDEQRPERPKVKVTDRRGVRPEEQAGASSAPVAGSEAAKEAPPASEPPAGEPEPGSAPADGAAEAAGEGAGELEEVRSQAAEYREHLQRLQAEFDNYRKRVLKEQTRAVEMAAEPLVAKLLEVLDEFELALMAAEKKPDFDRFLHGVDLVYAKLKDILRSEGLERIEAKGRAFDPTLHEALMQSGEGDGEPRVVDVFRPGYTLKGRVIRPAGVKVARD